MFERLIEEHNQDCFMANALSVSLKEYQNQKLKIIAQNLKNTMDNIKPEQITDGFDGRKLGDTITIKGKKGK